MFATVRNKLKENKFQFLSNIEIDIMKIGQHCSLKVVKVNII